MLKSSKHTKNISSIQAKKSKKLKLLKKNMAFFFVCDYRIKHSGCLTHTYYISKLLHETPDW